MKITMKNIREVSKRIKLLNYIGKTLTSVESISINKRMSLQHSIVEIQEALTITSKLLWNLVGATKTQEKNINFNLSSKGCFIIIGSDGSLCGSYNNQIIEEGKNLCAQLTNQYHNGLINSLKEIKFIIIGTKIGKLQGEIQKLAEQCPNLQIKNKLLDLKNINGHWDYLQKILTNYKDNIYFLINQKHGMERTSCNDLSNKFQTIKGENQESEREKIFLEGTKKSIIKNIEGFFYSYCLHYVLCKAQIQEMVARLYFLKNAIDNCKNEIANNTQTYRLIRQEIITQEINEIIGGSL
jgi:ATP synthase F1 gamma subunit